MSEQANYNKTVSQESGIGRLGIGPVESTRKATGIDKGRLGGNYQAKSLRESFLMEQGLKSNKYNLDVNPFYYDQQLKDRRLTITLHPNAKYVGGDWKPFSKEECFDMNVLKTNKENSTDEEFLYRLKPIATAIASEDFMVSISNSWTEFGKTNPLEEMYNNIKPYAATVAALADSKVGEAISNYDYANSSADSVKGIGKVIGLAKKAGEAIGFTGGADQLADMLNRQITVQGTRFAYFSGSTSSFGNLSMKFTVFSDWILDGNDYRFITCYEQLEELYDYSMSKYKDVSGDDGIGGMIKDVSGAIVDSLGGDKVEAEKQAREFVERHFKWQMPPGGFRADLKSVDNVQRGTLKLRINDMYTLENLVITSMNVSYSRIPCKHPLESEQGKIIPLYADVVLNFQPATVYTDTALRAFVEGKAWATVNGEKNERDYLATGSYNDVFYEIIES